MVREKHQIILLNFKSSSPKHLFYKMAGYKFAKSMHVNWNVEAVS